jgi:hypothetical protein
MGVGRLSFTVAALALFLSGCATTSPPDVSSRHAETATSSGQPADPIPSDFAAGLAGFTAPLGMDFVAFGHALLAKPEVEALEVRFTRLAQGMPKLVIDIPIEMECWRYDTKDGFTEEMLKGCGSPAALEAFIRQNTEVLLRYHRLRNLTGTPRVELGHSMPALDAGKWASIDIAYELQQNRPEEAFRKWRANQVFVARLVNGPNHWLEKAIALVSEGGSLETLQVLLRRAPKTVEAHRDEILALIRPGDFSRYGLDELYRIEETLMPAYAKELGISDAMIKKLRPRLNAYLTGMSAALKDPGASIEEAVKKVRERHAAPTPSEAGDPEFAECWQKIMQASHVPVALLDSMRHKEARRRLFTTRLSLDKASVSDEGIVAYLQSAPSELRSPYDGSPAVFDRTRHTITFLTPGRRPEYDYLAVPLGER